ncbi:MAG: FG-GAP repeat domain-containing protein [Phycisphaerae bacterium]
MNGFLRKILASLIALLLLAVPAAGLINTSFTPVDLVNKADAIIVATATPDSESKTLAIKVDRTLKGKPVGVKKIDVSDLLGDEDFSYYFEDFDTIPVVIVHADLGQAKADAKTDAIAAVHIGAHWYSLHKTDKGYKLHPDRLDLKAVWDGGHKPLVQAVQYVQTARRPHIPTTSGVSWAEIRTLTTLDEKVSSPLVHTTGRGAELLFPGARNDWLVTIRSGKATCSKLPTASVAAARVDIDRDGKDEWIGTDGVSVYRLAVKGDPPLIKGLSGVIDLLPATTREGPAAIAVTSEGPKLIATADGKTTATDLLEKKLIGVRCIRQADANNDGLLDLIIATDKQLLVAAGSRTGRFAAPAKAADIYEIGLNSVSVGDFDGDGNLDLLLTGTADYGMVLLAGDGKGAFAHVLEESGELAYHGEGSMQNSGLCDINSDGLVDLYLLPTSGPPRMMFNRGFRSFGSARSLDLGSSKLKGADALVSGKVTAGAVLDVNDDGAQDLLCVVDGKLQAVLRKPLPSDLGAVFHVKQGVAGPIRVEAAENKRLLTSRMVAPGEPAFIGKSVRGPLEVTITQPGGTKTTKRVIVLKVTGVELPPADGK